MIFRVFNLEGGNLTLRKPSKSSKSDTLNENGQLATF